MEFKIEKGIEIPQTPGGRIRSSFLTICDQMEVGDSFLAPASYAKGLSPRTKAIRPKKFAGRKIDANQVRIWRIA